MIDRNVCAGGWDEGAILSPIVGDCVRESSDIGLGAVGCCNGRQYIMEGSFTKVWDARADVPHASYTYFMDLLMDTIRYTHTLTSTHMPPLDIPFFLPPNFAGGY